MMGIVKGIAGWMGSGQETKAKPVARRLYSVPAVMHGRRFAGWFEIGGEQYRLRYEPARATLIGNRLQMEGRLEVRDASGRSRGLDRVRARLASAQGGIGTTPPRRQGAYSLAPTTRTHQRTQLPEVESTGATAFTGVLYFHFEPLDGAALGVPADLNRVQLNARLAANDDDERALQAVYSSLVEALLGRPMNRRAAVGEVTALNRLLMTR